MDAKCGCGKEGRYLSFDEQHNEIYSCNKYKRCPTYDELFEENKFLKYKTEIYETVLKAIVRVNGMDYEYKAWAKSALDKVNVENNL